MTFKVHDIIYVGLLGVRLHKGISKVMPLIPNYHGSVLASSLTFQNMTLISRCACVDGCGYPILPRGMSLGSFLLLLLLLAVITYLLIGYTYRRFVIGARGIELFPHLSFWRDFPFLVQVGNYSLLLMCFNAARCVKLTFLTSSFS